jgi:hypothetical protein
MGTVGPPDAWGSCPDPPDRKNVNTSIVKASWRSESRYYRRDCPARCCCGTPSEKPRIVDPGTAAENPVGIILAVICCFVSAGREPFPRQPHDVGSVIVCAPFQDITYHVMETPRVRRIMIDRGRPPTIERLSTVWRGARVIHRPTSVAYPSRRRTHIPTAPASLYRHRRHPHRGRRLRSRQLRPRRRGSLSGPRRSATAARREGRSRVSLASSNPSCAFAGQRRSANAQIRRR